MATLKKNGTQIGTLEYADGRTVYMSNGQVLRNQGTGWKKYKKVKPGLDPAMVYAGACARRAKRDAACPNRAAYIELLCDAVPLASRWKLNECVKLMPGDADGVWSEMNDSLWRDSGVDLQDCVQLCRLFELGIVELRAYQAAQEGPHGQG